MPLQIIGAGYGRTGTESMQQALVRLGWPCYHMKEVMAHGRPHIDFWTEVSRAEPGSQHDWERVFASYTATVDNPGACVWRELMAAYPDAKVILTLHPKGPKTWYESTVETIYRMERSWLLRLFEPVIPVMCRIGPMVRHLVWERNHRGTLKDKAQAIRRYEEHIEEVKAAVAPDRLLIMKVSEGWAPLCNFLGVPVLDEPFPRVNDRAEMLKLMRRFDAMGYVAAAVAVIVLIGLLVSIWR